MAITATSHDWWGRLAAAALGAGAVLGFNAVRARSGPSASELEVHRATSPLQAEGLAPRPSPSEGEPLPAGASSQRSGSGDPARARSADDPGGKLPAASQLEQMNGQLAATQRQRDQLQSGKRNLEGQLQSLQGELQERDRYKFDLTREEWKQLAAEGKVSYRAPCMMPLEMGWKMAQAEQDRLGLSPEDVEALAAALLRSNRRVRDTLSPLCLQIVGKADVVELLGTENCLTLIDQVATRADFKKVIEARRQVAEVHAGLRSPPAPGEAQSPLFEALLLMSSEGKRFEADLAESFGPEEAQRIWRSMSCASTRR